jgi:hypothetical protein
MPFRTSLIDKRIDKKIDTRKLFLVPVIAIGSALLTLSAPAQQPAADAKPGTAPSSEASPSGATPSRGQAAAAPSATAPSATAPRDAASQPAASQGSPTMSKPSMPPGIDPKTMIPIYETIQEDWSSLEVGASNLRPQEPLVAQTEQQGSFTRILVQLQWRPGDPLDLWIILPKGVKKPPAVLYLYGAAEGTERFRDNNFCQRVTSGGVAAVGFVAALTGPRFHDRPMKQWFISELQESLGSSVHDVKFILDYLAQRGDVDMNRIGFFGEGTGATIAILAAAADPRIKAVDALDPWGDWPDFLAQSPVVQEDPDHENYVKPEFLKKVANLDPVKWLPSLKTPVRIQQIRQSDAMPMVCKESIKTAAPKQADVVRFDGPMDLAKREGQGRLFEWIKDQLQSGKADGSKAVVAEKSQVQRDENGRPALR